MILSLLSALVIIAAIVVLDIRLSKVAPTDEALKFDSLPATVPFGLGLITQTSDLASKYALAVLGALGFLLSRRLSTGEKPGTRLDRWDIACVSISAFSAILVIYFGLRIPVSLQQSLHVSMIDLGATGDIRTMLRFETRSLLVAFVSLWAYVFYQLVRKPAA